MINNILKKLLRIKNGNSPENTAFTSVTGDTHQFRGLIRLGAGLIFINSLMILPMPFMIGKIIDVVLPMKSISLLSIAIGILAVVNLLGAIFGYIQDLIFFKVNSRIILALRKRLFEKINRIPLTISRKFNTGYLMSRINDDPPQLAALFGERIIHLIRQFFTLILGLGAIFWIDWQLALTVLAILPFFILIVRHYGIRIRDQTSKAFERTAQSSRSLNENLEMTEVCKVFERPVFNVMRHFSESVQTYRVLYVLRRIESQNSAMLMFIGSLMPLAILSFGAVKIILGTFSIGMMITFMNLMNNVIGPASSLMGFNIELQKIRVALGRIGQILELPEEQKTKVEINTSDIYEMKLVNVGFYYEPGKEALSNISLSINKGEKIGIAGASGSGKTSLMKLLSGLYEFSGKIFIDGKEISGDDFRILRNCTAIINQEPFLFRGSIYENIKLADSNADKNDVIHSLKISHAWEFIKNMPDKENTLLHDRGQNLSIGQKQRLTIARALVRNSPILILDEATANVDNISEKLIGNTIEHIRKEKILLIVAHRLELLEDCDSIFMLDNGKIAESGTHKELLAMGGLYSRQYRKYIMEKEESLDPVN